MRKAIRPLKLRRAVVPSKALLALIRQLRRMKPSAPDHHALSDAYREALRTYRANAARGVSLGERWRQLVREGLAYLGGQADRHVTSLADYDHLRYGPFLGVSDEGSGARAVRQAAFMAPKGQALGRRASPLTLGVALDAERLGAIGEVPVGPSEFAEIWSECVARILMTTNVGSRSNVRFYKRAPVVTIESGDNDAALDLAQTALAVAFKPFLEAPGGPRPLTVFLRFARGSARPAVQQEAMLRSLIKYAAESRIAAAKVHQLGLATQIGWGAKGRDASIRAIDLAASVGMRVVALDGVVRKEADEAISLPGLLNYLPPELTAEVLAHANTARVHVRPLNEVDPDTVARDIWSALNTARAMGFDLGKYGLVPLTLEECERIIGQIQEWFPDWSAAPVFYVDQGIVSRRGVYVGNDAAEGAEVWLRMVARHKVKIVLIDTVDKARGLRILKTNADPKGLLTPAQIAHLNALGQSLGIKILWAGGITVEQAYDFGKLSVFGIYVTTAASVEAPVSGLYLRDPALAAEKEPTFVGVLKVKTLLEAGFLAARFEERSSRGSRRVLSTHRRRIERAGLDDAALARVLPAAWRAWWRVN